MTEWTLRCVLSLHTESGLSKPEVRAVFSFAGRESCFVLDVRGAGVGEGNTAVIDSAALWPGPTINTPLEE